MLEKGVFDVGEGDMDWLCWDKQEGQGYGQHQVGWLLYLRSVPGRSECDKRQSKSGTRQS
jgi:hypothetical protein